MRGHCDGPARYGSAGMRTALQHCSARLPAPWPPAAAAPSRSTTTASNGRSTPATTPTGSCATGSTACRPTSQQYAPGLADQLSAGREGCGVGGGAGSGETRQLESVPDPGPRRRQRRRRRRREGQGARPADARHGRSPAPGRAQGPQVTTAATGSDAPGLARAPDRPRRPDRRAARVPAPARRLARARRPPAARLVRRRRRPHRGRVRAALGQRAPRPLRSAHDCNSDGRHSLGNRVPPSAGRTRGNPTCPTSCST